MKRRTLILGASGIIGQTLRLYQPASVKVSYASRHANRFCSYLQTVGDLSDTKVARDVLEFFDPGVIINLAGQSNTDIVERHPSNYRLINTVLPSFLAKWCDQMGAHLIQVSTQAVFGGRKPPYSSLSSPSPINQYGIQKATAESEVKRHQNWTIVRPTFVLGVRPIPSMGRENPVEAILKGQVKQVADRFFSISFAASVAKNIWRIEEGVHAAKGKVYNIGSGTVSRFDVARMLGKDVEAVRSKAFPGIAERPMDTTYDRLLDLYHDPLAFGKLIQQYNERGSMNLADRATEIAMYLGIQQAVAEAKLSQGFGPLHEMVTQDFRLSNPRTEEELLRWYTDTNAYIWELSAYHMDPGFNYSGMCTGVSKRLHAEHFKRILVLGDGIGDLSIHLHKEGFQVSYHDLKDSHTQLFAAFRFFRQFGEEMPALCLTQSFEPVEVPAGSFDAVVCLDFLEHVPNVEQWTERIVHALRPGGMLCVQNAFNMGSGFHGAIPCHLEVNDHFEADWVPLCHRLGLTQAGGGNWWEKHC